MAPGRLTERRHPMAAARAGGDAGSASSPTMFLSVVRMKFAGSDWSSIVLRTAPDASRRSRSSWTCASVVVAFGNSSFVTVVVGMVASHHDLACANAIAHCLAWSGVTLSVGAHVFNISRAIVGVSLPPRERNATNGANCV